MHSRKMGEAIALAAEVHRDQVRKNSGLPYVIHPIQVANILWDLGFQNEDMYIAAILHDTIEDHPEFQKTDEFAQSVKLPDLIEQRFGKLVLNYVNTLTFVGGDKDKYLRSFARCCIRPLIIKVIDRLCNCQDFKNAGKDNYAISYLKKSIPVFDAFVEKEETIAINFGGNTYGNLHEFMYRIAYRIDHNTSSKYYRWNGWRS